MPQAGGICNKYLKKIEAFIFSNTHNDNANQVFDNSTAMYINS
jgi:hypothetical protein